MGVLIDSSVVIDYERGRLDLPARLHGREEEPFFLSVISASEILHGVHRATEPRIRARRAAFVEGILAQFPLLPIDLPTARAHAEIWARLESTGIMIGPHDTWLAASCIAHGLAIATANVREFARVPGLVVQHCGMVQEP